MLRVIESVSLSAGNTEPVKGPSLPFTNHSMVDRGLSAVVSQTNCVETFSMILILFSDGLTKLTFFTKTEIKVEVSR